MNIMITVHTLLPDVPYPNPLPLHPLLPDLPYTPPPTHPNSYAFDPPHLFD